MKFTKKISFLFLFFAAGHIYGQSIGGTTTGAASYCSTTNSGVVSLTGYTGLILNWQSSTDGGTTWNNIISAAPNQTYFDLNQTTCYRAVVKNGVFPPDTSTTVCVNVYPPSIGGTISGGGHFCAGSGAGTLTLSGYTGSILHWLSSTNNGTSWTVIADITNTYTYTNITQNTLYRALVRNGASCPPDTSALVSFTIDPATVHGTINSAASVCAGFNGASLTLTGYTGAVLGWQSSANSGASWTSITNTTASQSYLNLTQTTWYRAMVKSGSCNADTAAYVIINVSPATVAGTLTGGGIYCGVPATGTLTLAGYTGNIISWASSTNNGITYTTIANTSAVESYTNVPVTTKYVVIVKSGACLADTCIAAIVSKAPQTIAGMVNSSSTACAGSNLDTLLLTGNIGRVTGWLSSINNGGSWSTIADTAASLIYTGLTQATWYEAIVQSGSCLIDTTAHVIITVVTAGPVSAGLDASITPGQSAVLHGTGTGTPLWTPGSGLNNPAVLQPLASPNSTTEYILTVTDINGCKNSDTVVITVNQVKYTGKVSNLFTPNGDGINDFWFLEGIQNFSDNEVTVYNIYGMEVYSKKGYINDWQGTYNGADLPDGTYYYIIKFENSTDILKGAVDILRSK